MAKRRTPDAAPAPISPFIGKSAEIAAATKERVLGILGRSPDLVPPDVAEVVASREADWQARAYVGRRMEGYENDQSTRGPGVTLFVREKEKDVVIKKLRDGKYVLSDDAVTAYGSQLWAISLPEGEYSAGFGGVRFYAVSGEYDTEKDAFIGRRGAFGLGYDQVVRIEGRGGALWQNVHFTPDGSKKKR